MSHPENRTEAASASPYGTRSATKAEEVQAERAAEETRLQASKDEAAVTEERRRAIRELQRQQNPAFTRHEPDLNGEDVRHFEVDSHGSLTFILFVTGEAWVCEELPRGDQSGQPICGRVYKIRRV